MSKKKEIYCCSNQRPTLGNPSPASSSSARVAVEKWKKKTQRKKKTPRHVTAYTAPLKIRPFLGGATSHHVTTAPRFLATWAPSSSSPQAGRPHPPLRCGPHLPPQTMRFSTTASRLPRPISAARLRPRGAHPGRPMRAGQRRPRVRGEGDRTAGCGEGRDGRRGLRARGAERGRPQAVWGWEGEPWKKRKGVGH